MIAPGVADGESGEDGNIRSFPPSFPYVPVLHLPPALCPLPSYVTR